MALQFAKTLIRLTDRFGDGRLTGEGRFCAFAVGRGSRGRRVGAVGRSSHSTRAAGSSTIRDLNPSPARMLIELTDSPEADDEAFVIAQTRAFNAAFTKDDLRPLCVFVRDGNGSIVGGLTAKTYWD